VQVKTAKIPSHATHDVCFEEEKQQKRIEEKSARQIMYMKRVSLRISTSALLPIVISLL